MTIQDIEKLIAKGETQNAFCHRRYEDPRTTVTLAIFGDRSEITNPGHFPNPLTPENIKEPHGSYPYNLRIAQVLYLSKYLEGWGTGIRRMMDICREESVPEPEYKSDGYTVTITFWKAAQKTIQKNAETIKKTIRKDSETIQNTIQKVGSITKETIRQMKIFRREALFQIYHVLRSSVCCAVRVAARMAVG